MKIQLKLMGMLKDRAPEGELELGEAATIEDVLDKLGIPAVSVQAFSINGAIERNRQRGLAEGDELTLLPPVGGG